MGTKRSVLFVVKSDSERNEWVQFITDSLKLEGQHKESVLISILFGHGQSAGIIVTEYMEALSFHSDVDCYRKRSRIRKYSKWIIDDQISRTDTEIKCIEKPTNQRAF